MPGVKGNSGGKKGRSGRRPLSIELKRLQTIDKAWDTTHEYLHSKEPLKDRTDVAVKIVTKDIPDQVQHSGNLTINYGHRTPDRTIRP